MEQVTEKQPLTAQRPGLYRGNLFFTHSREILFEAPPKQRDNSKTIETLKSATAAPESATEAPESATEAPESATAAPESATEAPKSATAAPKSATAAPKSATEAPLGNRGILMVPGCRLPSLKFVKAQFLKILFEIIHF
ncbi:hypothetical protein GCM10011571_04740 [Marinithermofilum abyssi]|uniref:Uncharacterized protein n=1 Tax=Marinithermofilum abyssi TaxID=1571185 RepID=A0A8J2VF95_9BACL|nr:hypothetical protein GCM10011571_04740 [Marinithermofilum abyssi]